MDMIFLYVERSKYPFMYFAEMTYFLFDKHSSLPGQDAFAVFGTPDKMITQLVRDVFGALCFHPQQSNMCSSLYEAPGGAAFPLLEREGDAAAHSSTETTSIIPTSSANLITLPCHKRAGFFGRWRGNKR